MNCNKCNENIPVDSKFCIYCGVKIEVAYTDKTRRLVTEDEIDRTTFNDAAYAGYMEYDTISRNSPYMIPSTKEELLELMEQQLLHVPKHTKGYYEMMRRIMDLKKEMDK